MPIIDVHCHLFNFKTVEDYYPSDFFKCICDSEEKVSFLSLIGQPSQKIAEQLLHYYPEGSVIVPLMMDFGYGGKLIGETIDTFNEQLINLRLLKERFKKTGRNCIFPFLAVDPRRPNIFNLVKQHVKPKQAFIGVKIYPPLGYLPSHPKLMEVFKHCQEKDIPITTHCIPNGSIHCKTSGVEVNGIDPATGEVIDSIINFASGNDLSNYFANPINWLPVLQQFPKLRLNFGHFGGFYCSEKEDHVFIEGSPNQNTHNIELTWRETIVGFMQEYENVYADLSFIMVFLPGHKKAASYLLSLVKDPKIGDRILYGSDFYMVYSTSKKGFATALNGIRLMLGDQFDKIAWENPKRFLKLEL